MLGDANFDHTVTLLLEHGEQGAVGVVLNRPSTVEVAAVLPGWADRTAEPRLVFVGGPVSPSAAIALGRAVNPPKEGWHSLFGEIGTIDLDLTPDLLTPTCPIRVFSGYAGWGPGQLEDEVEAGGWIVAERYEGDVVSPAPLELWSDALRRQPPRVAMLARYPQRLRAN